MNNTTELKAAEILESAAAVIQGGFWTQAAFARTAIGGRPVGHDTVGAGCWCALGAMREAADTLRAGHLAYELAEKTIERRSDVGFARVPGWNDAASEPMEVAQAMWEAAAALKEAKQ